MKMPSTAASWKRGTNNRRWNLHGCPCGFYGDATEECSCSSTLVAKYQKRISGPMLDRIDIHVDVPCVAYEKLAGDGCPTTGS